MCVYKQRVSTHTVRRCETIFSGELGLLLYLSSFFSHCILRIHPTSSFSLLLPTVEKFDYTSGFIERVCTYDDNIEVWITLLTFLSFYRFVRDFMFSMPFVALSYSSYPTNVPHYFIVHCSFPPQFENISC